MSLLSAAAKRIVDKYGGLIDVLKFESMAVDQYRQGVPVFSAAVSVQGHISMGVAKDKLELMGLNSLEDIAGVLTFTSEHLVESFPTVNPRDAITLKDEIGVLGRRWAVSTVHVTAHVNLAPIVVLVGISPRKGREQEAYP